MSRFRDLPIARSLDRQLAKSRNAMWISDTSIKRPVFATMVIVSFMVLGIVSMSRLGIDLFPDVNFPFVNVSVVYPGAGPEEVETLVTKPIEDAVAGINGVK